MDFKVGDVVVLKSGGSEMRIEKVEAESNEIWCRYFDDEDKDHKIVIDAKTLELYE